jgi:hypothetical protein
MNNQKICKPTNSQTRGYESCGKVRYIHKFGLCTACFYDWLTNDERGKIHKQLVFDKKVEQVKKSRIKKERQEHRQQKRELNISGVMNLADKYFSRYIRLIYSKDDFCTCFTCGTDLHIKEVDNGHYMKREHKSTRYHENNCRPQCKSCNGDTKHNGKQGEFRVNLANQISEESVLEVEKLSKTTISASYTFFKEISDYYREKVNEIQKQMKVKYW